MTIDPKYVLYTEDGAPIGAILDGSTWRLAVEGAAPGTNIGDVGVLNSSDVQIDPATEPTAIAAKGVLDTIDAAIASVKDTDGVKKITDALPAGTNKLGTIEISDSILAGDNTIGRVKLTDGTNVAGVDANNQLKVIAAANTIPAVLANFVDTELLNGAASHMGVDGSVTPVEFSYTPGVGETISLTELRFVFVSDDILWDPTKFGTEAALTNGMAIKIKTNGVETTLRTIKTNIDFLKLASADGVYSDLSGAKDILIASLYMGGSILLKNSTTDHIKVVISDDMDKGSYQSLTATIKGSKVV